LQVSTQHVCHNGLNNIHSSMVSILIYNELLGLKYKYLSGTTIIAQNSRQKEFGVSNTCITQF